MRERSGARVSVLGATTVDGAVLTERQRPLVAALGLHRDPVAPVELLVEAVWAHEAPDTARQSLQNQVTRLRRRFGAALIETAPGGYRLGVPTDAELVDARLTPCLEGRVGRGDVERIESALALWSGVPYADLLDLPEAEPERARLELLRERAGERLAFARIATGDITRAVVELEALTRSGSLGERRWELLMVALHLDGRRVDALAAFDRAAAQLDAELGVAPSPRLVRLRDRISSGTGPQLAEVAEETGLHTPGTCGAVSRHRGRCVLSVRR